MPYTRPEVVSGQTRITKSFVDNILDGVEERVTKAEADGTYAASLSDPFRYDSTRLRAFKAALAKRATTPVDIFANGDSIFEGQGISGSSIYAGTRWVDRFKDLLRAQWQPSGVVGGYGYRSIGSAVSGYTNTFALTGTGSVQNAGGLGRKRYLLAQNATISGSFVGTGVDLIFLGGINGTFTYQIDGGAAVSVNTMTDGSAATGGSRVSVRSLASASHTLLITITGTQNVYFEGIFVYNGDEAKGIRMWEGARSGYRTEDFIDGTGVYYASFTNVQPDLVILGLGTNDAITSTIANRIAPATYAANLQTIIGSIRAKCVVPPSIILWRPAEVKGVAGLLAPWSEYLEAVESVARADGAIAIFDAHTLMGDQSANLYGMLTSDKIHPTDAGHQAIADALMTLVRAA